jgi:hypothetical protein
MSERFPGGFITRTPPVPTTLSASGVWTVEQAMEYQKAGTWPYAGPTYIEDVFSTYLYTGNGTTQTITNGINLSTYGGLVWAKDRDAANSNTLYDTARGVRKTIYTNTTGMQVSEATNEGVYAFGTTGFSIGGGANTSNGSGNKISSWTFRKQPKFFDVQVFNGHPSSFVTVNHNLGSVPGFIVYKRIAGTPTTNPWYAWHRTFNANDIIYLNTTDAKQSGIGAIDAITSTATTFYDSSGSTSNQYVAYFFAHDAGGFGLTGTDNVISCGAFTTDGSGYADVNLGYEPQWILMKASSAGGAGENWITVDNMRGLLGTGTDYKAARLNPNLSDAEASLNTCQISSTGFKAFQSTSITYIYIAIRRGPMKVPTSGTSVFSPIARTGTGASATVSGTGFPIDMLWSFSRTPTIGVAAGIRDRLRGVKKLMLSERTTAETSITETTGVLTFTMDGMTVGADAEWETVNKSGNSYINWFFKRAPSFMDVVAYNRTSSAAVTHNLGVTPELLIIKRRGGVEPWGVMRPNTTGYLLLNATDALSTGLSATATSTTFTIGAGAFDYTDTYVVYLFATCAGVSKVGSYTGNGTTQTIACGFTAGARFVLIKRTDSTGDWYVWDTARGIITANDPHLSLNTVAAEVTTDDTIDPDNTGFIVNQLAATNVNVTSATYIFLAIA